MEPVIRTEDLPVTERFDAWHELISHMLAPVEVTSDDPMGLRVEMHLAEFGAVQVSSVRVSPSESHRTPKLIRRSDPATFQLLLQLRGRNIVTQDRKSALLRPSDLVLYHTSRPYHVRTVADEDTAEGLMVVIPHSLLPLPARKIDRTTVTTFSGQEGIGALLSGFLARLTTGPERYRPGDSARLGTILTDLLAAQIAYQLDTLRSLPPEVQERTLLLRIYAFIHQHLRDPELSPATIAAAHNISTRTLHRLFQTQNCTVSEWIRDRRLERCRRDLADPELKDQPIHAIAVKWGFTNAPHFSRTFRTAHALTPRDYRRQATFPQG